MPIGVSFARFWDEQIIPARAEWRFMGRRGNDESRRKHFWGYAAIYPDIMLVAAMRMNGYILPFPTCWIEGRACPRRIFRSAFACARQSLRSD